LKLINCADVLVLGAGPAALCVASELVQQGLNIQAIASNSPHEPWPNTYGIWAEELETLNMAHLLEYRWNNTVSFFGSREENTGQLATNHSFDYGLFDQKAFQKSLLKRCDGLSWIIETVESIVFKEGKTEVKCSSGATYWARIVIDASGHRTTFIKRPKNQLLAQQAAYGIVGKFSSPPVDPDQFVLMDFRPDHLNDSQRVQPPSFLYAMDFGKDIFFIEETSLACAPPLSFEALKERLYLRMSHRGIEVKEIIHEEHCLFPMNLPLPYLDQPLLAFGGAASMVHPASGYMVGALLRRAPALAENLAKIIAIQPPLESSDLARQSWRVLWNPELVQRHRLYQFGLERLMSFDEKLLRGFFATFFKLPTKDWYGFLANTLPLPKLLIVMLRLFYLAPLKVKIGMTGLFKFLEK
tara:strand:- start:433 stop:1671 length:1239 start_codon:yes stop_codon:yes gene_type:complete